MAAPTTVRVMIPAGTIVFEHRNSPTKAGVVEDRPVTLKGDVFIDDATRQADGGYGYMVAGICYSAATMTVRVLD